MSVMVVVPDSPEGFASLAAGIVEAERLGTDLVVVNIGLAPIDESLLPESLTFKVVERRGRGDRDPVDMVLDEIGTHGASRLVIGIKRRSAVGKAILGSVSQQLLLESPVPVLAVKLGRGHDEG